MNKEIICFHNPDEENGYFSNQYISEFVVQNIQFIVRFWWDVDRAVKKACICKA